MSEMGGWRVGKVIIDLGEGWSWRSWPKTMASSCSVSEPTQQTGSEINNGAILDGAPDFARPGTTLQTHSASSFQFQLSAPVPIHNPIPNRSRVRIHYRLHNISQHRVNTYLTNHTIPTQSVLCNRDKAVENSCPRQSVQHQSCPTLQVQGSAFRRFYSGFGFRP